MSATNYVNSPDCAEIEIFFTDPEAWSMRHGGR